MITCYSTADDCAISEGEGWPAVRVPALTRPLAQSINLQPVTVKSSMDHITIRISVMARLSCSRRLRQPVQHN